MANPTMPLAIFRIKDRSMQPSIRDGDYVMVNRLAYVFARPKVGDVVILRRPSRRMLLIKRVSKISSGGYFVTGDNKMLSEDSRRFGPVEKGSILGKVFAVIHG